MTIQEAKSNIGKLVFLNGKGNISENLKIVAQKKIKLEIVKAAANGDAVLELPDARKAGFIIMNPIGIDIAPKYNLQRS